MKPDRDAPLFRVEIEGESGTIRREIAITKDFDAAVAVWEAMRVKFPSYEVILRQKARVMRRSSEWDGDQMRPKVGVQAPGSEGSSR